MSEHHATIDWTRNDTDFTYKSYTRDHRWVFRGGLVVAASAAPGYLGNADLVDPEEAFVASLSSCHMLTFLAFAAKKGLVVDAYRDAAVGWLAKNDDGRLAITRVTLRPEITFAPGTTPSAEDLAALHDAAHHACFIANSVKTEIAVESAVETGG